ncbi:MAG TPA: GNAT family protein [Candidatus Bathyarchaeia archaeon]|nr:GNAT family protein [Candidatus Bathyarchaeia archaeon]
MEEAKNKSTIQPSTKFETKRLLLRKYENNDGKALFDLLERNDNRNFLKEHVDEATDVKSLKDADDKVKQYSQFWESRVRFIIGIWLKETNNYIGNIWIEPKKWEVPSFELGYYLDQGYTRKGLALEATKRAVKFIFEELHAYKIIIITRDNNERSYRLAERLHFIKEGHLRETNIENNRRFGLIYYGLLKDEYKEFY